MTPVEYKTIRKKLGLTQESLAGKIGVSRRTVSNRESGLVPITKEAQLAMRQLLSSANSEHRQP